VNDWLEDDKWQKEQRDVLLAPFFYGQHARDGRYVFMDKGRLATVLQKRFAVDTVMQCKSGASVCIEEKIVRWKGKVYDAICLETHSCTKEGHESDGWMVYGEADYLLYCMQQADGSLHAYLIDFPKLKEWFWPRVDSFAVFGPLKTLNATKGRVVPLADIHAGDVPISKHIICAPKVEAA
jgi:hypothetical protein